MRACVRACVHERVPGYVSQKYRPTERFGIGLGRVGSGLIPAYPCVKEHLL